MRPDQDDVGVLGVSSLDDRLARVACPHEERDRGPGATTSFDQCLRRGLAPLPDLVHACGEASTRQRQFARIDDADDEQCGVVPHR